MKPAALVARLRGGSVARWRALSRRARWIAGVVAIALAGAVLAVAVSSSGSGVSVRAQFVAGTAEPSSGGDPVRLDTSLYLPANTPAPAVLLSQGFGGDKSGTAGAARRLAERGYVVLTYSARGFGRSGGAIHFAAPDYEVRDGRRLLDYLAGLPQVRRSGGKPLLATAGSSYGGALSLLIAAADHRVRAVAADITWNDLEQALFPNFGPGAGGVFKKLWAGDLFANAVPTSAAGGSPDGASAGGAVAGSPGGSSAGSPGGSSGGAPGCGRFAPDVCAAYQASAAAGAPTAALRTLMRRASPASVLDRIDAPTLLTQGEQDSLFPLSEADANARGLAAHGTPVRVVWRTGGHDTFGGGNTATAEAGDWFDGVFAGRVGSRQRFRFDEQAGVVSAATGNASQQTLQADAYPGTGGAERRSTTVTVRGAPQPIAAPSGGAPAAVTTIPGLGGLTSRLGAGLNLLPAVPGQTAFFATDRFTRSRLVAGTPTVRLTVTALDSRDAVLFVSLRDVAADGTITLPSQLVAPVRLSGLTPGEPRTVTVRLPSIVRNILSGHRLVLTVSTTDFAYALPNTARTYLISLGPAASIGAAGSTVVTLPTVSGTAISGGRPVTWLIVGGVVALVVLLGVGAVIVRRRLAHRPRPDLADVPVSIAGLVKEYAGGYRAVDDVSFTVERGQVVGLLGPNGAGKTTTLRVLVGLITPTAGAVHVFGQPIVPGAAVLARLGAFIEGPGFLPHLTGRENLRLYWAATGRPADEAEFATALDIAGLGGSVDRRVRTYSHGMKQRLGIAQAMLGLPEVLVLDEPTNGLDPPQIAEMREVLQDYARTGRTVVVSSHLLAEVEQTCTHVVVMHKGHVVAAGPTSDIAGAGGVQLAVPDPDEATRVLAAAGIVAEPVPARRALEDVFLELIGDE
jgi:ABC-2 type transport system ATP-binding protein